MSTAVAMLLLLVMRLSATTAAAVMTPGGLGRVPSADTLSHCPTNCSSIDFSYPFGIGPGCFRPGFSLNCTSTYPGTLLLGNSNITVDDIWTSASGSISTIRVSIIRGSVSMTPGIGTYSISWESPGRPFAISGSSNMSMFILGCGVTASLLDHGSDGEIGNCTVLCAGVQVMERLAGLCIGVGCCRIDIQVYLRAFTLKILRTGDAEGHHQVKAFVTGRDSYVFTLDDLYGNSDDTQFFTTDLDWAIPDQPNCERAMENKTSYACISSLSACHDSPLGGYVCLCSTGFSGNPYIVDGCMQDQVYGVSQRKAHCPTTCGNVSIPFPFGTEVGCFAKLHLYLTCDPGTSPPILEMSEHLMVTDISVDEGILYVRKISDSVDFPADRNTSLYAFSEELGEVKWAIDNLTCEEAKRNKNEYMCLSAHGECVNVTDGRTLNVGYRCKCSFGFEGNPYIEDGCTDIDECLQPDLYICNGICQNTFGNFTCTNCPHGTDFDPIRRQCKASNVVLGIAIGLSCGGGLLFLILVVVILIRRWKKGIRKRLRRRYFHKNKGILLEQLISSDKDATDGTKIFSLEELEKATNNFEHTRVVGRGGHGMVYKGILTDQRVVAIKRSRLVENSEIDQFINEVAILSQINHRNVVKLYGCCLEAEVPLLVYEFISNGTLYDLLHRDQNNNLSLPWEDRVRIATEIAGALTYLHSAASVSIFHRDVKSLNILLNDNYTVKVSDFGASRSIPIDQTHLVTTVQGTFGYLDPEYYHTGQLTEKSDVYSFGVILVELLMRKKPIFENDLGEKQNLSNYFLWGLKQRSLVEIMDAQVLEEATEEEITDVACLAEMCLSLRREERPTMKDAEMRLQFLRTQKCTRHQLLAQRRDEALQPYDQAARSDGIHSIVPAAGHDVSGHYSLEQEFMSSVRLPR